MWTALELIQVNITAYLVKSLRPSLTLNGPKQSIAQYVKGGVDSTPSSGKSAIFDPQLVVFDVYIAHTYGFAKILQQRDLGSIAH